MESKLSRGFKMYLLQSLRNEGDLISYKNRGGEWRTDHIDVSYRMMEIRTRVTLHNIVPMGYIVELRQWLERVTTGGQWFDYKENIGHLRGVFPTQFIISGDNATIELCIDAVTEKPTRKVDLKEFLPEKQTLRLNF